MDRPHRILLVEASRTQAIKLSYVLEKEGCEVVCAFTPQEALAQLDRGPPDMILLDSYLPGMRGAELCRRIRLARDTRNIPILMMTAEETDEAEVHGLESSADGLVPTSLDPDLLLRRIRALLGKAGEAASILRQADTHFRHARLLTIEIARLTWSTCKSTSAGRATSWAVPPAARRGWSGSAASRSTASWWTW
jgi:two-component system NtrC family sensor kinase